MLLINLELAARGHSITTIVHRQYLSFAESQLASMAPGDIPASIQLLSYHIGNINSTVDEALKKMKAASNPMQAISVANTVINTDCKHLLVDTVAMERLRAARYDLLLGDPTGPCPRLLGEVLGLPRVDFLTGETSFTGESMQFGLSAPGLAYSRVYGTGLPSGPLPLLRKAQNLATFGLMQLLYRHVMLGSQKELHRLANVSVMAYDEIQHKRLILVIIGLDFALEAPRPYAPLLKYVGPISARPPQPLLSPFREQADAASEQGFIVVSFGGGFTLYPEGAWALAKVLASLNQTIFWRLPATSHPDEGFAAWLPPHVLLSEWLPQNDLLGHPNCRAFVSHGGIHGTYEAIYHAVPTVVVPMFDGDQVDHRQALAEMGMGVGVDGSKLDKGSGEELAAALSNVLGQHGRFQLAARKASRKLRAHPTPPVRQAAHWVEYALRAGPEPFLWPLETQLSWFQLHNLDVAALALSAVLLPVTLLLATAMACRRGGKAHRPKAKEA